MHARFKFSSHGGEKESKVATMKSRRQAASTASSATLGSRVECLDYLPEVDPAKLQPICTIGKGCFGRVVLAKIEDDRYAVKVTIKTRLTTGSDISKAISEAKIMRNICPRNPYLCHSRGAFQTDEAFILVMDFAVGGDLYFHLQREGPMNEGFTKLLAMQIVSGLQTLHSRGVVHRDIKPENILITGDGRAQITDFGLSKYMRRVDMQDEGEARNSFSSFTSDFKADALPSSLSCFGNLFTRNRGQREGDVSWGTTRTRCGTPTYRCPDAVAGNEYGLEADYWALGCLVYECLLGFPAFAGKTIKELNHAILNSAPKYRNTRPLLSPRARLFIQELLVKDRTKRLGYGAKGAVSLRSHSFFTDRSRPSHSFTWEQIANQTVPSLFSIKACPDDGDQLDYISPEFKAMDIVETASSCPAKLIDGYTVVSSDTFHNKFVIPAVPVQAPLNAHQSRMSPKSLRL